jgi:hypothetical protein
VVSGGFVEGDFLAGEAFEFGDELVFASLGCEAVVPVGAEVGEVCGGVGEQVLLWLAGGYVLYCWLVSIRIL